MTEQLNEWSNKFGDEYTKRNLVEVKKVDDLSVETYGISRSDMNRDFLDFLDRDARVLEVGTNIGLQLNLLSKMGFKNLYCIEINETAIQISHELNRNLSIYIVKGSALDIPFKDNWFDLVYTSGVLIHIHPNDIGAVIGEVVRCSKKYVWGFEYYTDEGYKEINYRGKTNLLWKTDFKKQYQNRFPDLRLIKEKLYPYLNENLTDQMFLLEK